jgi:GNAT superfamily N-acetyltransferase
MTEVTSVQALLAEAATQWRYDGMFYHVEIDGEDIGAFCIDDIDESEEISLSLIKVRRGLTGQGYGTGLLDMFCDLADKHCVAVQVEVVPTGHLEEDDLIAWYRRRGFEMVPPGPFDEGPKMSRSPQPVTEIKADREDLTM